MCIEIRSLPFLLELTGEQGWLVNKPRGSRPRLLSSDTSTRHRIGFLMS